MILMQLMKQMSGVNLTSIEQEVLSSIQKNNEINAKDLASQCKVSTRTIERSIKSLKEKIY